MNLVQLITLKGVQSFSFILEIIQRYYPDAHLALGEEPRSVLIAVPNLYWRMFPDGEEDFFGSLVADGAIESFTHQAYSDYEVCL